VKTLLLYACAFLAAVALTACAAGPRPGDFSPAQVKRVDGDLGQRLGR
jgi:hypothetical protein